jgi:large subunit ribosomal protein L4
MPKVDLYNVEGEVVGDIDLNDNIFGIDVNKKAVHDVILNQLANKRQGTQSTKTISDVRGGGKRPWRQKGTGRARHGSTRSAQWVGGGTALGPKPRSYNYTMPKKIRRLALKSVLTSKVNENEIVVLDNLTLEEIKTKRMVEILGNIKAIKSTLIVLADNDKNIIKSAKNIKGIKTAGINTINVYDIVKYEKFVITKEAVEKIEEVYA